MRIEKIAIENFRLLQSAEMSLERTTTLIVGRNNSGKTSITEFFAHVHTWTVSKNGSMVSPDGR